MEIEVTEFIHDHDHDIEQFILSVCLKSSDSVSNSTWRNALKAAESYHLCDADTLREHFREYGAWSYEELASMSELELRALLLQFIASDYLEGEYDENSGALYRDPVTDRWFYYLEV